MEDLIVGVARFAGREASLTVGPMLPAPPRPWEAFWLIGGRRESAIFGGWEDGCVGLVRWSGYAGGRDGNGAGEPMWGDEILNDMICYVRGCESRGERFSLDLASTSIGGSWIF